MMAPEVILCSVLFFGFIIRLGDVNAQPPGVTSSFLDDRVVVPLPKCCRLGEKYDYDGDKVTCVETKESIEIKFKILWNNETHLDDEPLKEDKYIVKPYHYNPCTSRIIIEEPEYAVLLNGSLIVNYPTVHIAGDDEFCIEQLDHNQTDRYHIFFCMEETVLPSTITNIYKIALIISSVLLVFIIICWSFILKVEEPFGWNLVCYAVFLEFCVILLTGAIFNENFQHKNVARLYQCLLFLSLVLQSEINYELYYMIKYYSKSRPTSDQKRLYWYGGITLVFLVITCLTHYAGKSHAQLPPYVVRNPESIIKPTEGILVTYVFNFIFIILNVVGLVFTYLKINAANRNTTDRFWPPQKGNFTYLFRANLCMLIIISISMATEFATFYVAVHDGFLVTLNIIHALQGAMFALLYFFRKEILDRLRKFYRNPKSGCFGIENSPNELEELNK